jgi:hypothetical protein
LECFSKESLLPSLVFLGNNELVDTLAGSFWLIVTLSLGVEGGSSVTLIGWGVGSGLIGDWVEDVYSFWSTGEVWLSGWFGPFGVWPVGSLVSLDLSKSLLMIEGSSSVSFS